MARRVFGDRQGQTDRIQTRGHGPMASIDITGSSTRARVIKSAPVHDFFRVSIAERLVYAAPAVAWAMGVR